MVCLVIFSCQNTLFWKTLELKITYSSFQRPRTAINECFMQSNQCILFIHTWRKCFTIFQNHNEGFSLARARHLKCLNHKMLIFEAQLLQFHCQNQAFSTEWLHLFHEFSSIHWLKGTNMSHNGHHLHFRPCNLQFQYIYILIQTVHRLVVASKKTIEFLWLIHQSCLKN